MSSIPNRAQRSSRQQELANDDKMILILLDKNAEPSQQIIDKLRHFSICYIHCKTAYECVQKIRTRNNNGNEQFVLVSLESFEQELAYDLCKAYKQLVACYLVNPCSGTKNSDSRVVVFDNVASLLRGVEDYLEPLHSHVLALQFFDQRQRSTLNLSKEGAHFMWSQLLLDVLRTFSSSDRTMDEMLAICENYYMNSKASLAKIELFRRTYTREEAIKWYTKDSFLYRLLNKALRSEDIEALYIFRSYILDLCAQLEKNHYEQQDPEQPLLHVYRGQCMTLAELISIEAHKGDLVSVNSFLSTSKVDEIAKLFIGPTSENHQSVLFIIDVDMYLKRSICADVSSMSNTPEEREVLFVLSSVFKVVDVRRPLLTTTKSEITSSGDPTTHCWIVHLMASDEGRERLDEYRHLLRKTNEEDDPEITFGRLEIAMGAFNKAANYFTTLLAHTPAEKVINRSKICQLHACALYRLGKYDEALTKLKQGLGILDNANISNEDPTYLRCQFQIANVYVFKCEYASASELYMYILDVQRKVLHENHQHIADTLSGLSWVTGKKGNLAEALEFNMEALRIKIHTLPADHPLITESYKALGGIYEQLGRYDEAMQYFCKALEINKKYLPFNHATIGGSLVAIGSIHDRQGNTETAMRYYEEALKILEENFPDGHASTANVLDLLGQLYRDNKQFDNAVKYHHQAAEIRKRFLQPDHIDIATGLHYLAKVCFDKGDNQDAITLFEQACQIKKKHLQDDNPSLCRTRRSLATAYSYSGEYEKAREMFEKTLADQRAAYLPNGQHREVAATLHDMGNNFLKMKRQNEALECYRKCLDIRIILLGETNTVVLSMKEEIKQLESMEQ